ncbi:hypothetical protein [Lysobacter gummosus]
MMGRLRPVGGRSRAGRCGVREGGAARSQGRAFSARRQVSGVCR